MTTLWVVRAGSGGVSAEKFLDGGYIEIGFWANKLGARAKGMSREQLAEELRRILPNEKKGQHINSAGQLFRFHEEIAVGDEVITYDPTRRRYLFGTIASGVEFVAENDEGEARYRRRVKWTHRADRDSLGIETRNTLGSTLTLFKPNDEAADDLRAHRVAIDAPAQVRPIEESTDVQVDAAALGQIGSDMAEKSNEFVEDRIAALEPYDMQDLVAGILRAMGYKARVSPPGPDGGHDIFASPDGLGLQEPRIFVEVKHRKGTQMGAPEIRSFLGGRRSGDRCLYVSTGGFTKDARAEAARASVPITLVDLALLRDLLTDYYEKVDPETKQLVPLKRFYWPIEPKE